MVVFDVVLTIILNIATSGALIILLNSRGVRGERFGACKRKVQLWCNVRLQERFNSYNNSGTSLAQILKYNIADIYCADVTKRVLNIVKMELV